MIWMITAMPAASRMGPAGPARSAMAGTFVALREKMGQLPGLATSWP
jgi:hypothetical protein